MKRCFLMMCVLLSRADAQDTAKVELKHKPAPSTTFNEELVMKVSFSFSILGRKQTTRVEQIRENTITTGPRADDGTVKVVHTPENLRVKMRAPGMKAVDWDVAKLGAKAPANLRAMATAKFEYVFDRDDKLKSASVLNPDAIEGFDGAKKQSYAPENLMKSYDAIHAWLPGKPVAVGDTWERTERVELDQGQGIKVEVLHTYRGIDDFEGRKLHRVDLKPGSATATATAAKNITVDNLRTLATSKGAIWFDAERGRIHHRELKIRLKGSASANMNGRKLKSRVTVNFDSSKQTRNAKKPASK